MLGACLPRRKAREVLKRPRRPIHGGGRHERTEDDRRRPETQLRPGGQLIYLVNGTIHMLCTRDLEIEPATDRLLRDYFGMHRFEWHDQNGVVDGVEFHLGHGDMIRHLRSCGFEVEDLLEIPPPSGATSSAEADVTLEWARRWPSVEAWKARNVGGPPGAR